MGDKESSSTFGEEETALACEFTVIVVSSSCSR